MASYDARQYSLVFDFYGESQEQSILVTLSGNSGEAVAMHFSTTGKGTVQVESSTKATGFFPIEQYHGFIETVQMLMANGGAIVSISETPATIRVGSQGTLP